MIIAPTMIEAIRVAGGQQFLSLKRVRAGFWVGVLL